MAKKAYIGVPTTFSRLGDKNIGDIVKLNENGSPAEYIVVHHGLPSSIYDVSCNGTWLLRKNIYSQMCVVDGSANNHYPSSTIHTNFLNNTFISLFDASVQSAIKQVKLPYAHYATAYTGANGVSTKAFLLGMYEVGFVQDPNNAIFAIDGAVLSYFNSTARRIAYHNGSISSWWLRTPNSRNSTYGFFVTTDGSYDHKFVNNELGIRPAMILSSDAAVSPDGIVTGGIAGTHSFARKIKKGYIGVDGVARKIKKAYIGIGGVARPCWSGGEFVYYGTTTSLSHGKKYFSSSVIGNYAVFAGGYRGEMYSVTVDAYNPTLTRTQSTMTYPHYWGTATTIGNYMLIGGGRAASGYIANTTTINASLTISSATNLITSRNALASTTVGDYAIFAGGSKSATVDAYNKSLTRSNPTQLNQGRNLWSGATIGNYAIFAGGDNGNGTCYTTVDVYDKSLTHSTATALSIVKTDAIGVAIGDHALFAGGTTNGNASTDTVDVYDKSLTHSTATALSRARGRSMGAVLNGFAFIAGGNSSGISITNPAAIVVDVYNETLTRTVGTSLSAVRHAGRAEAIGNYALVAGGESNDSNNPSSVVDVYTVV